MIIKNVLKKCIWMFQLFSKYTVENTFMEEHFDYLWLFKEKHPFAI